LHLKLRKGSASAPAAMALSRAQPQGSIRALNCRLGGRGQPSLIDEDHSSVKGIGESACLCRTSKQALRKRGEAHPCQEEARQASNILAAKRAEASSVSSGHLQRKKMGRTGGTEGGDWHLRTTCPSVQSTSERSPRLHRRAPESVSPR
jgi:hypothetical protein